MKNKKFLFWVALALVAAGFTLWQRGRGAGATRHSVRAAALKYQCPMHPQIVRDKPGDCPICHMKLDQVETHEGHEKGGGQAGHVHGSSAPAAGAEKRTAFTLSDYKRQLIGVRSAEAREAEVLKTLRLPGRVGENNSFILAQALEMDGGALRPGLKAEVYVAGEESRKAVVTGVDNRLDSFSRTFAVSLSLSEPPSRSMRPGVYCNVRVQLRVARGLSVPREAVLDTGDEQVVFVESEGGRFEPRQVRLGPEGDEWVEVRKGLKAGEKVVVSANFLIDSESRFKAAASQY